MVLPVWLQSGYPEGTRHYHFLLLVIRRGNSLEYLESVECYHTALSLMRNHATYRLVENARGGSEMVGSPGRVCVHSLPQIGEVLQLVPIEGTGLVYLFTSEIGYINCKKWTFKRHITQIPEILTPPPLPPWK